MNRIFTEINPDTNYVYHMLSCAKCGYDNDYGDRYAKHHPAADLALLKENERHLTVCGGDFIGALYTSMVIIPARAVHPADEFYRAVKASLTTGEVDRAVLMELSGHIDSGREMADVIVPLCDVMIRNYATFRDKLWDSVRGEIAPHADAVGRLFAQSDFTDRAESMVGCELEGNFYATFCACLSHGAEAVDISDDRDVFGIDRSPGDAFYFIAHEFIIYLLKKALAGTAAFCDYSTWQYTEGLAEYYLYGIMGQTRFFNEQKKYADFYREIRCGCMNAAQLFEAALENFGA